MAEHAAGGGGEHGDGERGVLGIAVVGENAWRGDGERLSGDAGEGVVLRDGRVIHRRDRERDGGRRGSAGAVAGLVGEAGAAGEVRGRSEGERAVRVQRHTAIRRLGGIHGGEREALGIAVIGEHAGRVHRERSVLRGGVAVGSCNGRALDVDGDGDGVGEGGAVIRTIGEGAHAGESSGRDVGERAVRIQSQRAGDWQSHNGCRQRAVLHIRVIGEHAGGDGHGERDADIRAVGIGDGDRRVVHGSDGEGDGGGG